MSLDNRVIELIAIGASVGANCQPCLEYHVAKALENGSCKQEIQEAINVGITVRKGAANKMDKYIVSLWENVSSVPRSADKDCECGCGGSC